MKKIIIVLALLINTVVAQNVYLTTQNYSNDSLKVNIVFDSLPPIAGISLVVEFDSTFVKYDKISNINPNFSSGAFVFSNIPSNQFRLIYFNMLGQAANANGTLCTLHFYTKLLGCSYFNFSIIPGECELNDIDANIITTTFNDTVLCNFTTHIPNIQSYNVVKQIQLYDLLGREILLKEGIYIENGKLKYRLR